MPRIGLITEGPTDFQVLRLLLNGLCGGDFATPLMPVATNEGVYPPTGWITVLNYVRNPEFADALNNKNFPVDFVVVHLDSDSCELFVPAISHVTGKDDEVIQQIKQRLMQEMEKIAPDFYATNAHRILFAIAVRSTECWLLPLFFNDNKRTKTANCVETLNGVLEKREKFFIDKKQKQFGYKKLLRLDELKARNITRDKVIAISQYNPGLADFVRQVEGLINPPAPIEPDTPPEP